MGDAKVGELYLSADGHEDILGAHVAMHQVAATPVLVAKIVGVGEGFEHLQGDVDRQPYRKADAEPARLAQQAFQVRTRYVLEDHVELAGMMAELEHLHDVLVLNLARQLGLFDEHASKPGVVLELVLQPLDDHRLFETRDAGQARAKDLRHAAQADRLQQLVTAVGPRTIKRGGR